MKSKRQRSRWLALFLGGLVALTAPVSLYLVLTSSSVSADSDSKEAAGEASANPRAEYWRAVRHGVEGYSAVTGPEANVLIQDSGQTWRELRNGPGSTIGAWLMAAVLLARGVAPDLQRNVETGLPHRQDDSALVGLRPRHPLGADRHFHCCWH